MNSTRLYDVNTPRYGVILRSDDNIAAARRWAARAFPREAVVVRPHVATRASCSRCESRPCCCPRRIR